MKIRGIIRKLMPAREGISQNTGNPWKSQAFIVDYFDADNQRSADSILCETFDKSVMEKLRPGATVGVIIGHHVRDYNDRYYNDVRMYGIEFLDHTERQVDVTAAPEGGEAAPAGQNPAAQEKADKLPF